MNLKTKEAVQHVLATEKVRSKYALAKVLQVNAIMINNYLNRTRMGTATAERFKQAFNITITDVYDNRSNTNDTMDSPS